MKNQLITLSLLFAALAMSPSAPAQGTAFTYQGRLTDNGGTVSGIYDLRFTIYDLAGGGTAIAGPLTNASVAVSSGLFTTVLDFGSAAFAGPARWLEIGVRTNGSSGDFTTLTPRQPITPAPYALFAGKAAMLAENASQTFTGTMGFNPSAPGAPPFAVGSSNKVTNLNADLFDGLDSTNFLLKSEHCLTNLAELKARAAGFVPCVTVLGYYAPGDGGGGNFYWDASAAEPDNSGTVVSPAAALPTGRWKRLYSGAVNVKWFGVSASGDIATAITAAVATAGAGGRVLLPPGAYLLKSTLAITQAIHLDAREAIITHTTNGTAIEIGPVTAGVELVGGTVAGLILTRNELEWRGEIGLKLQNLKAWNFDGIGIRRFTTGILATGLGQGFVHNVLRIDYLIDNRTSLEITPGPDGWAKDNTVIGGDWTINANAPSQATFLYFWSQTTATDNWRFIGCSFQTGSSDDARAASITTASALEFLGCRWETDNHSRMEFDLAPGVSGVYVIGGLTGDLQWNDHNAVGAANDPNTASLNCLFKEGGRVDGHQDIYGQSKVVGTNPVFDLWNSAGGAMERLRLNKGDGNEWWIQSTSGSNSWPLVFGLGNAETFRINGGRDVEIANLPSDTNSLSRRLVWGVGGPVDLAGMGSPENVVAAPPGSTYRRKDGGAETPHFYVKQSGPSTSTTGWTVSANLSASAPWDPPPIVNGATVSTTFTVSGVVGGDPVAVGFSQPVPGGALLVGSVTAPNTITVTLLNLTGATLDLAPGTLRADARPH